MPVEPPSWRYQTFLLRIWAERGARPPSVIFRLSLEDARSQQQPEDDVGVECWEDARTGDGDCHDHRHQPHPCWAQPVRAALKAGEAGWTVPTKALL